MTRRVVVTGLGIVSPLGCGVELVWRRLIGGCSGLRLLADEIADDLPAKVGGIVQDRTTDPEGGFDPEISTSSKELKKMARFIQMAMVAADEALTDAGWIPQTNHDRERTATIVASGIGGFPALAHAVRTGESPGVRRLSPFTIPSFLSNLAAGQISIKHQFRGAIGCPVTACAASVQAIGDAMRLIRTGEADIVLAGGAEAAFDKVSIGGFAAARALSTSFNDQPTRASRPFDRDRDGFVMGEGAAMLVVEALDHAVARGARPIAEVIGYGTTSDAYHITAGPDDGSGAMRAMKLALAMAEMAPNRVDYVNAHATSTPVGDAGEIAALKTVFGTGAAGPAISSTKSATGHLLGAAGAIEAVFSVLALRDGVLPGTLNLEHLDECAMGLDLIGPTARRAPIQIALSNGFGFGGVNASVLFQRFPASL
ncbi:beta-ketoacyl-[acyl-carrier-protein] synthase II [Verminephrobacter aporrectodeae subsp. tuberculatae]|uniref:beta-ketoacyl-ACP synthase II n=1 Tax=Verminephrobacter aporrectodeae TaxID=1110389 RepID=UPI0022371576|nr:beta-ketoacyl-ACP synthase II [Verminephrobacter aporrectodeae]MCW5257093.1 beta-ketoacyl-[acyl-carrier-protein] synthase II [Verminephrobacter aporrectodeae subsp. tuberculatae]